MDSKNERIPAKDRRKDEKQEYDRRGPGPRSERKAPGESGPRKSPPPSQPDDEGRWLDDGGEAG